MYSRLQWCCEILLSMAIPAGRTRSSCEQNSSCLSPSLMPSLYKFPGDNLLILGIDNVGVDIVGMAGLAAEGLKYDKVMGQSADLFSLQRLLNRSKQPLKPVEQQNLTRWAVLFAASLIKNNDKAYDALMAAMAKQLPVSECIKAMEQAN
jgi:hypothetical protein